MNAFPVREQVRKEYTLSYVIGVLSLLCMVYLLYHGKPGTYWMTAIAATYFALAGGYMLWCAIRLHRACRIFYGKGHAQS